MQIAVAVVMLNGAGLLVRTLARLESVDLGYRSDHLSILRFTGEQSAFPDAVAGGEVGKQLLRRFESTPGVVAATLMLREPFIGQSVYTIKLADVEQPVTEREQNPFVPFDFVGPKYFRTLAIPILHGCGFTASDTRVPNGSSWSTKRSPSSSGRTRIRSAVRTTRPLATMLPAMRAASHDVNPALVIWDAQMVDQLLDALAQPRLSALLLAGFSLVALLLSAIGRVALGAMPCNIRRLVLAQVFGLVGVGVIAGLAGALAGSRLLRSMLFQVNPIDALTLAGVCVLLPAVATVAAYLPARRAARIDLLGALRAE